MRFALRTMRINMQYLKEQTLDNVNVKSLTTFLGLSGVALALPFFVHLPLLTGPIINAIFILLLFLVGIRSALVVALIPSLMALSGGLLPAILAPAVPFIMVSNVIFIVIIDRIYNYSKNQNQGYWIGVVVGAFVKFVFLFSSVSLISKLLIKQELAAKVMQLMSWPQFATALTGGIIAWVALKWLKRI
ncbi:MAG: [Fe] hydrogenase, HymD subunit [Parcubacteria group bacterium GW2011_GWE2_38_18]|nr:MAG: [Fe] hydrogenase, HymD subunit [Parcubacteria group bacterium GW2011_GWE2_38_18]